MELTALCRAWAETLCGDAELRQWAEGLWGAPLNVFLGYDAVREFGREDAPYVVIQPLGDERGPQLEERAVRVGLFLGCAAPAAAPEPEEDGGPRVLPEVELMEREFAPRVLDALLRVDPPPAACEGETLPPVDGFVEKYVLVSVVAPSTLGMGRTVWR